MKNSNGNVLFILLVAIVLFVAITFAVSSTSRTGDANISREKIVIATTEVVQQMTAIKEGVYRLVYSSNCAVSDIDFYSSSLEYYDAVGTYASDLGIPTNRRCSVYDTLGGGVTPLTVPVDFDRVADLVQSGQYWFSHTYRPSFVHLRGVGIDYSNSTDYTASELVIAVNTRSKQVCQRFNEMVGYGSVGSDPVSVPLNAEIFSTACPLSGEPSCPTTKAVAVTALDGVTAACVRKTGSNSGSLTNPHYTAYMVLFPG